MIDGGDCGVIGGMKIGRGNRSTRRKPDPAPFCPPQIPLDQTRARTRCPYVTYVLNTKILIFLNILNGIKIELCFKRHIYLYPPFSLCCVLGRPREEKNMKTIYHIPIFQIAKHVIPSLFSHS
jgi:hypothetical protein